MIRNNNIERKYSIKFFGVMLDDHISWTDHERAVENKIVKNIGLLYRVSQFLHEDCLKTVYFSYILSYLNYSNIEWANTYVTKLKSYLKQEHAVRIVFNKDKLTHSKPLFENLNTLNAYQINIYQHLNLMNKFIDNQTLSIFSDLIKRPDHKYPTTGILWIVQNVIFPSVDLNYGMMLLIKKRKITNLILSFKRKLNES